MVKVNLVEKALSLLEQIAEKKMVTPEDIFGTVLKNALRVQLVVENGGHVLLINKRTGDMQVNWIKKEEDKQPSLLQRILLRLGIASPLPERQPVSFRLFTAHVPAETWDDILLHAEATGFNRTDTINRLVTAGASLWLELAQNYGWLYDQTGVGLGPIMFDEPQ